MISAPARIGDWVQTYSGRSFWPLDPHPEDVDLEDIAHALAFQCRYGGHVMRYFSVAEHAIEVSHHVTPRYAAWGLLHDAAEAYLVDLPRPVKRQLPLYAEMETKVLGAIIDRFGLERCAALPLEVKLVDERMLVTERDRLMRPCARDWGLCATPYDNLNFHCWTPEEAEVRFLIACDGLGIK